MTKGSPAVAITALGLASDTAVAKGGGPYGVMTLVFPDSKRNLSIWDVELGAVGEPKKGNFSSRFRFWRRSCAFGS